MSSDKIGGVYMSKTENHLALVAPTILSLDIPRRDLWLL